MKKETKIIIFNIKINFFEKFSKRFFKSNLKSYGDNGKERAFVVKEITRLNVLFRKKNSWPYHFKYQSYVKFYCTPYFDVKNNFWNFFHVYIMHTTKKSYLDENKKTRKNQVFQKLLKTLWMFRGFKYYSNRVFKHVFICLKYYWCVLWHA